MGAFGMHSDPENRDIHLQTGCPKNPGSEPLTLTAEELKMVNSWIERHSDPKPSRSEAVHRLLICALNEHPGQ